MIYWLSHSLVILYKSTMFFPAPFPFFFDFGLLQLGASKLLRPKFGTKCHFSRMVCYISIVRVNSCFLKHYTYTVSHMTILFIYFLNIVLFFYTTSPTHRWCSCVFFLYLFLSFMELSLSNDAFCFFFRYSTNAVN